MSGLKPIRQDAKEGRPQESFPAPSTPVGRAQSPPLGLILFCRRKPGNGHAVEGDPGHLSKAERTALAELERRVKSRIYRVYACEKGTTGGWEYFAILEFVDLRAWSLFEQDLAGNGFGDHFDWDIRAFGRRLS